LGSRVGFGFFDLFVFADGNGEFADLVQGVPHRLGDLLYQGFRSKKGIRRLSPLLDELLVLVEFFGIFDINATDISLLNLVTVNSSCDKTNFSVGVRTLGSLMEPLKILSSRDPNFSN